MAKAKKLPSGNWRVRVYTHTDASGKQHYESFTAPTKTQAEMMAAKFASDVDRRRAQDLTVQEAVQNYISSKKSVFSPSTINGYRIDSKRFEPISHLRIRKINSKDMQDFISLLIDKNLSPKTIKNTYGLLLSSLKFAGIDTDYKVHLPSSPVSKRIAPESEQITELYNNASHYMKIAIMLAAFHSLRRGEICGLKYGDLNGNELYIHSDVVKTADGKSWYHKEIPKTEQSNRVVYLREKELELIGTGAPDEYIVPLVPNSIGTNFDRLKKRTGINIRFHDLRVYFASISAAIGIPEVVTSHHGGWKEGSQVLKRHYQKPIQSIDEGYAKKLNNYFEEIL